MIKLFVIISGVNINDSGSPFAAFNAVGFKDTTIATGYDTSIVLSPSSTVASLRTQYQNAAQAHFPGETLTYVYLDDKGIV